MAASRMTEPQAGELGPTGRPFSAFPDPQPLMEHGPARTAAVCNQKGGVGKTTTTINLGAALAELGRRVLLVDFDPQGALSVGLGIQPHDIDGTIYNLLMERDVTAQDVLVKTGVNGMDLLPSNIDLSGAEVQLVHEVGREYVLGGVLEPLVPDYDVIMIDCQPSLGLLTINALASADGVIIPLECEYFAMRGVALLTETIDKVSRRLNTKLTIDGLLATMYDSRTLHTREVLASIVNGFGDKVFHTVINRTVSFRTLRGRESLLPSSLIWGSMAANSYRELAKEVLGAVASGRSRSRRVSLPGVAELLRPAASGSGRRRSAPGQRPGEAHPEDHRLPRGARNPVGLDYSIWLVGGLRSSLDALLGRLPGGAPPAQLPDRAGPERGVQRRRTPGAAARERRAAPPDQQGPLPAR